MINLLWDLIFPTYCVGCKKNLKNGHLICEECFSKIKINSTLFCGKCRMRLAENKKICHLDFPYLLGIAANYQDEAVKSLIWDLKFRRLKSAAKPLNKILANYLNNLNLNLKDFLIIPIPLGKNRERKRGFNQAEILAKGVSSVLGSPLKNKILIRIKETKPQTEIRDFEDRKKNLENSFAVAKPDQVFKKNILLIDDVITSGATLYEAARILKSSGAQKIISLTVASSFI